MMRGLLLLLAACGGGRGAAPDRVAIAVAEPGASVEELEAGVANPIEEVVGRVAHVEHVRTAIDDAGVRVELELDRGADAMVALEAVRAAMTQVMRQLPAGAGIPMISVAPAEPVVVRYTLETSTLPLDKLSAIDGALVRRELERIPGVLGIDTCGAIDPQWVVSLDVAAAARYHLGIGDVVRAIRGADRNGVTLRTSAPFAAIEDLAAAPIAQRDGQLVALRDVAAVSDSAEAACRATTDRGRLVAGTVRLRSDADPRAVVDAIARVRAELPSGVTLEAFPAASGEIAVDGLDAGRIRRVAASSPAVAHLLVTEDRDVTRVIVAPPSGAQAATDLLRKAGAIVTPPDATTVQLFGPDRARLADLAVAIGGALRARGIVLGAGVGLTIRTEAAMAPDRAHAADLGISTADIAEALRASTPAGLVVTTLLDGHPIVLRVAAADLHALTVPGANNTRIPLDAVVTATRSAGVTELRHDDRIRWVGITASGDSDTIRAAVATVPLPAGYRAAIR